MKINSIAVAGVLACAVFCSNAATENPKEIIKMKQSEKHPTSSLRFWSYTVTEPGALERQLRFIKENPGCFDDIWLGTLNGLPTLEEHIAYAEKCARAAQMIREAGLGLSLQITESLGHWGYGAPSYAGFGDWRMMVDQRGVTNENVACIQDEGFLNYITKMAAVYADKLKPDTIWIDDDWRMNNHGQVQFGCFCEVCLQHFSKESGKSWTRETLNDALSSGAGTTRSEWLKFNQKRLAEGAAKVAAAIHAASPETRVALQNSNLGFCYNGMDFDLVYQALAENSGLKAGVRVGGGAYTDFVPVHILDKAYTLGPTAQQALNSGWVDLAIGEVENYPHSLLGKSAYSTAREGALDLAFGCNGLSFVLGYQSKTDAEESAYFRKIAQFRPFYERLIAMHDDGAAPVGVNPGRAPHHVDEVTAQEYRWTNLDCFDAENLLQSGIPVGWRIGDFSNPVALVYEEKASGMTQADFEQLCRSNALVSGNAYLVFQEKGFTDKLGIRAEKISNRVNYWERFEAGAFNGADAGTYFSAPAAYGPAIAFSMESDACNVEVLGKCVSRMDDTHILGNTTLLLTTPEGGKWGLSGMPGYFTRELTGFKQRQLLRMVDALWQGGMPAMPEAGQPLGMIPWCRKDGELRGVVLFNPSIAPLEPFRLALRHLPDSPIIRLWDTSGAEGKEIEYRDGSVEIPALAAWEVLFVEVGR